MEQKIINPIPDTLGTGLYRKRGEPDRVDAVVKAYETTGKRQYRFELHWNGQCVRRTEFFGTVWSKWRCDIPLKYCFDAYGRQPPRSPRAQELHTEGWNLKIAPTAFKKGDLIRRGNEFAIVSLIEVEKVPLETRLKYHCREVRIVDRGRIPVVVDGQKKFASYVWKASLNRYLIVYERGWRKVS